MGTRERRKRQDTRQLILDTARAMFVEHGYEAVTMRKLAERIAYSPTAIYVHFADKEALMRELSICDFQAFADAFLKLPQGGDPLSRLQGIGRAFVQFALEHKNQYRLLFMTERPEAIHDESELAAKPEVDAYTLLMGAVQDAREAGLLHPGWDPDAIAQTFWGSLHGIVALHLVMPTKGRVTMRPVQELTETAMALVVAGFARPPESLRELGSPQ